MHDSSQSDLVVKGQDGGITLPKRSGFAEKLLGVRNSRCDTALAKSQRHLNKTQFRQLRHLQETTSKVRYEYKVMQVDKKRNELELSHRNNPETELNYEDQIMLNSTKYLQYKPGDCHYLDKKNRIRARQFTDPTFVPPSVKQARKMLQDQAIQRKLDYIEKNRKLRAAKSAPPQRKSAANRSVKFVNDNVGDENNDNNNNIITDDKPAKTTVSDVVRLVQSAGPTRKNHCDNSTNTINKNLNQLDKRGNVPSYFSILTNPKWQKDKLQQIKATNTPRAASAVSSKNHRTETSVGGSIKVHLPDITTTQIIGKADDKCDSDIESEPEKEKDIAEEDIVSKLKRFGIIPPKKELEKPMFPFTTLAHDRSKVMTARSMEEGPVSFKPGSKAETWSPPKSARSGTPRQPITKDKLRQEAVNIQGRINKFFTTLEEERHQLMLNQDEDEHFFTDSEEEDEDTVMKENKRMLARRRSSVSNFKFTSLVQAEDDAHNRRNSQWEIIRNSIQTGSFSTTVPQEEAEERDEAELEKLSKLLRRDSVASRRGSLGPPMHAAERSNRHTATFKLKRLVEDIMSSKTRYEKFEINELRKRFGSEPEITIHHLNPDLQILPEVTEADDNVFRENSPNQELKVK